jgi:hypothetical protein
LEASAKSKIQKKKCLIFLTLHFIDFLKVFGCLQDHISETVKDLAKNPTVTNPRDTKDDAKILSQNDNSRQ